MKHKTNLRRMLCMLMCAVTLFTVCVLPTPISSANSALTDAKVQGFEDQIANLQAEQKRIRANLQKLQRESASLYEYKAELDTYLETTSRKMEAAQTLLTELSSTIEGKKSEIEANTAEYNRMQQKFFDMMVLSHEEGDASYIGLILGAESLSDFLSRLERLNSMMEYNRTVMKNLDKTGKQLQTDKLALEEAVAIQEATMVGLKEDEVEYQKMCDEVIVKISALSKDQNAAQKELAKNQAEEAKLDKQLEEYLIELQKKNQLTLQSGDWYWPVPLNSGAYCSSPYGWRILYGAWDYHRGWDLACWLGTDIFAAKAGKVVISTFHNSYGNYIVIDHGGGISTVYAHCSKLLVSVGDQVERGQHIADVGTTGNSTGYHLHFEFRKNGKYTDPFEFIKNPPVSVPASRYNKW